jgi:hypothetical protein
MFFLYKRQVTGKNFDNTKNYIFYVIRDLMKIAIDAPIVYTAP